MMPRFLVKQNETRELVFEVEADSADEAVELVTDMGADEALTDSFGERIHDWVEEMK